MSHQATAVTRDAGTWRGRDVDLTDVEDLDGVADLLRDLAESTSDPALLFVEEDDEWFGVVRLAEDNDPAVYVSDRRVLETSDLAERLFGDALPAAAPPEDDESSRPEIEPAGDPALLESVGVGGDRLVELTAEEGMLPGDVIAALAELMGATSALEVISRA